MLSKSLSYAITLLVLGTMILICIECQVLSWIDLRSVGVTALVAIVFFAFRQRLEGWVSSAISPGKPQSITLQTKETPSQITWQAIRAFFLLVAAFVVLLAIFLFLVRQVLDNFIPS